MKILMVCLGNICRSPIAEGVMRSKFIKYRFDGEVDSAGVIGFHAGEAPDRRAIAVTGKYDIDISLQVARQFRTSDFNDFDLILTMDEPVHREILGMAKHNTGKEKVKLFLEFANIKAGVNVPDPYYGGSEDFERVYKLIDEGCEKIIRKIQQPTS